MSILIKSPARLAANVVAKVANGAQRGAPHRKQAAALSARQQDYNAMLSNTKVDYKGYKKPGSNQR